MQPNPKVAFHLWITSTQAVAGTLIVVHRVVDGILVSLNGDSHSQRGTHPLQSQYGNLLHPLSRFGHHLHLPLLLLLLIQDHNRTLQIKSPPPVLGSL